MLTLNVTEKEVEIVTSQEFVCGTVGSKCKITFDVFWTKYNKTIVFKRSSKTGAGPFKLPIVDMDAEYTIPWEIMTEPGRFKIGAYGTTDEEVLPTLWSDNIRVVSGTTTDGIDPQPPTPSEYQQLTELSADAVNAANYAVYTAKNIEERANNGEFDGKDGEQGPQGPQGESGNDYILTESDKQEIAEIINASIVDGNGVAY